MNAKAILFDKDGTLIDFSATFNPATLQVLKVICEGDESKIKAAAEVLDFDLANEEIGADSIIVAGCGLDIAAAVSPVLGIPADEAFGSRIDRLFGEICLHTVSPLPGIPDALKALHIDRLRLGIATNDSQANATAQMTTLGIHSLFDSIFGADSGHGAKPHPGMITAFANSCGVECDHVVMVGDSVHDLEAGRAAGVIVCGVETGPASRSQLEPHADIVLGSVADLPEWLSQHNSV